MAKRKRGSPIAKRGYRSHTAKRLLRAVVGGKKKIMTFDTHPDRYCSHVWLDETQSKAVSFLAQLNGVSKMEMVHRLLAERLGDVFGRAIAENNALVKAMKAQGIRPTPTPFIRALIKWAAADGYDIKKFFT